MTFDITSVRTLPVYKFTKALRNFGSQLLNLNYRPNLPILQNLQWKVSRSDLQILKIKLETVTPAKQLLRQERYFLFSKSRINKLFKALVL